MKAFERTIDSLPFTNREHLAWRLDRYTSIGMIQACRIVSEFVYAKKTLLEVFMEGGLSEHSAKIHSKKVVDYVLGARVYS